MTGSRDMFEPQANVYALGVPRLGPGGMGVGGWGGAAEPGLMLKNMRSLVATGCSKLLT